jgi:hypothetical protein
MWGEYYRKIQEMAAAITGAGAAPAGGKAPAPTQSGGGGTKQSGKPKSWYQSGGIELATSPHQIVIGEAGPELVAAIPLSAVVNYNHNINMSGDLSVQGVSPSMEAELVPVIMSVLARFGQALLAQSGGR